MSLITSLLYGLTLIAISPIALGLEQWATARLQGRTRPWRFILQPYRDIQKLWGIASNRPETASIFFALTPPLLLSITIVLIFTIPWSVGQPLLSPDPILLVYLLGLYRFLSSLASLDGATPFAGMGSARTMFLNFITEINFFLWVAALILYWQSQQKQIDIAHLVQAHSELNWQIFQRPELLLLAIVLGILILYEMERPPVGDPSSHLELAMGEKALSLAWQGRDLAILKMAEMIRLTFLVGLFVDLFLPGSWPLLNGWSPTIYFLQGLFLLKLLLAILVMILVTSARAKLRLGRVAGPAFFAGALSLLSIVFTITVHLYVYVQKGGS